MQLIKLIPLTILRSLFIIVATLLIAFFCGHTEKRTIDDPITALTSALDQKMHVLNFSPSAEFFIAATADYSKYQVYSRLKKIADLPDLELEYSNYEILSPTDDGIVLMSGETGNGEQHWRILEIESGRSTTLTFPRDSLKAVHSSGRFAVFVYQSADTNETRCKRINTAYSTAEEIVIPSTIHQMLEFEVVINEGGTVLLSARDKSGAQRLFTNYLSPASPFQIFQLEVLPTSIASKLSKQLTLDGLKANNEIALHFEDETESQLFKLGDSGPTTRLPFLAEVMSKGGAVAPAEPRFDPALDRQSIDALEARGVRLSTMAVLLDGTRVIKTMAAEDRHTGYILMRTQL